MYELTPRASRGRVLYRQPTGLSGLGFSLPNWLTPPKVIRDALGRAVGVIESKAASAIEQAAGQVRLTPTPAQQIEAVVNQVPGGAGTLVAVGVGALLLLMFAGKSSR